MSELLLTHSLLPEVVKNKFLILDGETNESYHSRREFISASRLKCMAESPLHYHTYFDKPAGLDGEDEDEKKENKSLLVGTLTHTKLLEPDSFETEFYVMKDCDRRTKEGKEIYNEALLECKGRTLVSAKDNHKASLMSQSALQNDAVLKLLDSGVPEQSIYWIDEETGLPLKCRADFRRSNNKKWNTIVDVKTAKDASPEGFARAVIDHNYPLQAAMQVDGIKFATGYDCDRYFYIAIQNKFPFAVAPYLLPWEDVENGRRQYMGYLRKVKEYTEKGVWPGYEAMAESERGVIMLELPSWKKIY